MLTTHIGAEAHSHFEGDLGIGRWIRHRVIVATAAIVGVVVAVADIVVALTNKPAQKLNALPAPRYTHCDIDFNRYIATESPCIF